MPDTMRTRYIRPNGTGHMQYIHTRYIRTYNSKLVASEGMKMCGMEKGKITDDSSSAGSGVGRTKPYEAWQREKKKPSHQQSKTKKRKKQAKQNSNVSMYLCICVYGRVAGACEDWKRESTRGEREREEREVSGASTDTKAASKARKRAQSVGADT